MTACAANACRTVAPSAALRLVRAAIAVACVSAACSGGGDRWKGLVYPNGTQLDDRGRLPFKEVGEFETLDACSTAATTYVAAIGAGRQSASYECGRRCREANVGGSPPMWTYTCAEKAGPMAKYSTEMVSEKVDLK